MHARLDDQQPEAQALAVTIDIADVRILRERPDGSGVVELPISAVSTKDRSDKTSGITLGDLQDVVANFDRGRKGVIVGVTPSPHPPASELISGRGGPQKGFVDAVSLRGDQLWGLLDLGAELFQQVKRREWRGFSIEIVRHSSIPDVWQSQFKFEGWVLVGGVFTNRPATPTVFRIAAEAAIAAALSSPMGAPQEVPMSEEKTISVAAHESKVAELSAEIAGAKDKSQRLETLATTLQTEVANLRKTNEDLGAKAVSLENEKTIAQASVTRLELQVKQLNSSLRALDLAKNELELQVKGQDKAAKDERVKSLIAEAVEKHRVVPAIFEGYEANPSEWVESNFASLEAFEGFVRTLSGVGPKVASSASVKSGHDPAKAADPVPQLADGEKKVFEQIGLDATYVGAETEDEARKRWQARKAAAAK